MRKQIADRHFHTQYLPHALTTRTASSECPPNSKKLSCRPTRSTCSTSCHISASVSSISPSGASYPRAHICFLVPAPAAPCDPASRSASAACLSIRTYAAGTMYSGSVAARCARKLRPHSTSLAIALLSRQCSTPPAASPLPYPPAPPPPLPAPPHARSTAPRSLPTRSGIRGSSPDCRSGPGTRCSRPAATAPVPSPVHPRTRLLQQTDHAQKRSAVNSGRFRYPRATPAPPMYISPLTPTGTGSPLRPTCKSACSQSDARSGLRQSLVTALMT